MPMAFALARPFPIPELLMFFLHPFEIPSTLMFQYLLGGFGYEKAGYCRFAVSQPLLEQVIYHSRLFRPGHHDSFPLRLRASLSKVRPASDGQVHGAWYPSVKRLNTW